MSKTKYRKVTEHTIKITEIVCISKTKCRKFTEHTEVSYLEYWKREYGIFGRWKRISRYHWDAKYSYEGYYKLDICSKWDNLDEFVKTYPDINVFFKEQEQEFANFNKKKEPKIEYYE